jgi:hypothetical protein
MTERTWSHHATWPRHFSISHINGQMSPCFSSRSAPINSMCPRTSKYTHYLHCGAAGHKLPENACDNYAHGLQRCLGDPNLVRKFDFSEMKGDVYYGRCRFCKEGKDIDGAFLYGRGWMGAAKFRRGGW